ncbi:MAG: hypothetical protein D6730_17790 [Bacteroidetes bacterium]|nr:MAG: hypothetical protein D6730_17790 [Bacteroidota bacterium]
MNHLPSSKTILQLLAGCAFVLAACGPAAETDKSGPEEAAAEVAYDSLLARQYGADQYGMKKYVMAFLKAGPNRDLDSAQAVELQRAHLKNIEHMAETGKLVLAGPFLDEQEVRGIYIFDVASLAEAEALTRSDPAIQAGSLEMELREWYGSAALKAINDLHKKLTKTNVADE